MAGRGDSAAIAELDLGYVIEHEAVREWVKSWGAANELPPPRPRKG